MGRYYHGDIDGKFMVGRQSSDDADFFGVEGDVRFLNYSYQEEDLPKVEKGIEECENVLGKHLEPINKFFKDNETFDAEELAKHLNVTEENANFNLEWYARLELGKEIRDCIKENDECNFEAEL